MCSTVFSIRIVEPIYQDVTDSVNVGKMMPGTTMELIFSKAYGRINDVKITGNLNETDGFNITQINDLENFKILIDTKKNTPEKEYEIEIEFNGTYYQKIKVYFTVEKNLLEIILNNHYAKSNVNEKTSFDLLFVNKSNAAIIIDLTTDAPKYLLSNNFSNRITIPKSSKTIYSLEVIPKVEGEKKINLEISYLDVKKDFTTTLIGTPTIISKFTSPYYGFPFYSISVALNYYFNAILVGFLGH